MSACSLTPLRALPGIGERGLVARGAERRRAEPHPDACLVHHMEHVGEALVRLAKEMAHAGPVLAQMQKRVGGAAITHLVVQAGERHAVALADSSPIQHLVLGNDEQRYALDAGRTARDLRQHQVDDVFRYLLIASRYPHLPAEQAVRAVPGRFGARGDVGE